MVPSCSWRLLVLTTTTGSAFRAVVPDPALLWKSGARSAVRCYSISEIRANAGKPESISALRQMVLEAGGEGREVEDEAYAAAFGFELDEFQMDALRSLKKERNVIVSAPTGSGKTIAGELAIVYALARDQRVFYTTPLKALSNQKFKDFRERFGTEMVGLCTGDSGVNRNAQVVVMTTEVFRNMLYAEEEIERLYGVVLDEFHYMNDAQRGTVWEECVISCPRSTRIVALSATISNAEQIRGWMSAIHNETDLVESTHRPVPLRYEFASGGTMKPLFKNDGAGPGGHNPRADRTLNPRVRSLDQVAHLPELVDLLEKRSLLPAIVFQFSRVGCDKAAESQKRRLLDRAQVKIVDEKIEEAARVFAVPRRLVAWLRRGVASHHAGLLPSHKQLVEELFALGLVRVCYATETLAAGVNLPARTTVITSMSKKTQNGVAPLTATQVLQLAGRAGRRGLDKKGTVVFAKPRWRTEDAAFAHKILLSRVEPIESRFRSTYGMACSLLKLHDIERCKTVVENSFGAFSLSARWEDRFSFSRDDVREHLELERRADDLESAAREFGYDAPQELVDAAKEAREIFVNSKLYGRSDVGAAVVEFRSGRKKKKTKKKAGDHHACWRQFLSVQKVLEQYGAVKDGEVTAFGDTVAELQSDNELFLALAVRSRAFSEVAKSGTAAEFASLVGCLASDFSETRSIATMTSEPSPLVVDALYALEPIADDLMTKQIHHDLDLDELPIRLDLRVASVVESFAAGTPWSELAADSSLDDGDLVRLLRRTAEILRSISALVVGDYDKQNANFPAVRSKASRAANALDRPPVLDYVPADSSSL